MATGRKTGGRQKGSPNKATADIKALAQQHAAVAVAELARLATEAQSEPARVAAIKELLDRGFGKATQPLSGEDGGPIKTDSVFRLVFVDADPHSADDPDPEGV